MTEDADSKPNERSVSETTIEDIAIPDYLHRLLETIANREGFTDGFNIVSRSGSNVGDGYQGILISVVISGSRNDNSNEDLVLICKIAPLSEMRKRIAVNQFKREITGYEQFLPALVKFQKEKGISETDGFFSFPKCYGTYADDEKFEFAIVLEDLRNRGFRMWNKYKSIDFKHVQLALIELGKLHALSFALRQHQSEIFAQFQQLKSAMYKSLYEYPGSTTFFERNFDRAIQALHPNEDTEEIKKITFLRNNFKDIFRLSVSGANAEPFTVFCHGDFWNNNMMFQYDSDDSFEPKRVVIIDWQLSQYCSPVTDLTYYLYSCSEQPLRTAHFDDFLHIYHDSLANLLQRLGGSADKQFSFNTLQSQLNRFGIYSMVMAPFLIQVVTVKAEDLPDVDSITEENCEDFDLMATSKLDVYNERMRDVTRDFVGRGYFGEQHMVLAKVETEKM